MSTNEMWRNEPDRILNAYREGDLSFDEAVKEIEAWKDRKLKPLQDQLNTFIEEVTDKRF